MDMNNLILFLSKIAECHGCCYLMTVLFNSFAVCGNVHRVTRLENKTCLFFFIPDCSLDKLQVFYVLTKLPSIT